MHIYLYFWPFWSCRVAVRSLPCVPYVNIHQDGTTGYGDNRVNAVDMGRDGSVVLAGSSDRDFVVIKLDASGRLLWHFQVNRATYCTPACYIINV